MKTVEQKRLLEKRVVGDMIALYCHGHHGTRKGQPLCPDCAQLYAYACQRSDHCPFMETKTFCSNCRVHCYQPRMREKIREVMRYSGPRMLLHHPILAISHVIAAQKEKRLLQREADQRKELQ